MTRTIIRCVALAAMAALMVPAAPARAGGLYLLDRGTRPLGRGGAFVAGADDPGALWYNPAGLAFSGDQFLFDATLTFLDIDYTRIDGGGNVLPTVHAGSAPLPIPTIAGSFDLGLRHFTFGVGLFVPNAALLDYPESLTIDGAPYPAPQRYSMISMEGSILASLAVGAAWRPISELSIGASVHVITGSFAARVAMSACEGAICTFPEDPDYDVIAQMTLAPIFTASAIFGVTWAPGPVRIGASLSTPFPLSGNASIDLRLPSAASFDGAFSRTRAGDCAGVTDEEIAADPEHGCRSTDADVTLDFPMTIRLGIELLAIENLRLELAVVWETWSMHRDISVRPRDMWLADSLGHLDYEVGPVIVPRNMRDTVSVRLGGEYTIDGTWQIRLGGSFENGSFDDAYLSPMTIDSDKLVVSAGLGIRLHEGFWVDALVGYAHLFPHQVRNSRVPQGNTIRPVPQDPDPSTSMPGDTVYIGNGDYSFVTPFAGLGLRWQADWAPPGGVAMPLEEEPAPLATPAPAVGPAPGEPDAPALDEETTDDVTTDPIPPAEADEPRAGTAEPVPPAEALPAAGRSTGRRASRPR